MSEHQNNDPNDPNVSKPIYETPVKRHAQNKRLLLTNDESYEKSHPKSYQNINSLSMPSHTTMNIFRKKKYHRTIKKSNLKLLVEQSLKLNEMKVKAESSSEAFKQSYKNELDQVYVVVARIENINEDRKYYNIYCQDETKKEFKLYYLKNIVNQNSVTNLNKTGILKRRITDLDSVEFEAKYGEGTGYFKFFTIFREIPIFKNNSNEILKSDEHSDTEAEDQGRRNQRPKVKYTEFRIYVEHFEKVDDFNYLTFHNMHIISEEMYQRKMRATKMNLCEEDI